MIRFIHRRLIIPRGDTGEFNIRSLFPIEIGDKAFFYIYDPLFHKVVLKKELETTDDTFMISLSPEDTINLEPSNRYKWDIKLYHNPEYDENNLIVGGEVHSYFAAYKLPTCDIREW